jgi:hypothetical protein
MEEDVYNKESRAEMVENDEMSPKEAAFMEGAEGDGQKAKCRKCGNAFADQDPIEKEIDGKVCWFCSDNCLKEYEKEHE